MLIKKTDGWPLVISNDYGIRPAGQPDQCFYCQSIVGDPHHIECVTIKKLVKYNVFANNILAGTLVTDDPHHWDIQMCEFHKNESSWCSNNVLDDIVWSNDEVKVLLDRFMVNDNCSCSILSFEFSDVIDEGPFITTSGDDYTKGL